ncbi:MAG: hypothetical protein JJT94_15210 [Bernardetiaceae bacterium]|nr:hypothetical protein [Bernardetiaceae bacterium]
MKQQLFFLSIVLILCMAKSQTFAQNYTELEQLVESKQVTVHAHGLGGYFGERLRIEIRNIANKALLVNLPAGAIFNSQNTSIQDLITLKDYQFAVQKGASKILTVSTACIQASNGSPFKNAVYAYKGQGDPEKLGKIAKVIAEQELYSTNGFTQSAVWCVSDNKDVAYLAHPDPKKFTAVAQTVCDIQGKDFKSIDFKYQKYNFHSYVRTFLAQDETLTLEAYNSEGELISTVFQDLKFPKGFFYLPFMIQHKEGLEASIRMVLKAGEEILQEQEVTQDSEPHAEDMTSLLFNNRLVFVADENLSVTVLVVDEQERVYSEIYRDKPFRKSSQTVINIKENQFLPKHNKYFIAAYDSQGKQLAKQLVYNKGEAVHKAEMKVQRYNFQINLVDPLYNVNLDVYDTYGNKVANVFENSKLAHGDRVFHTVFKHYLGNKQTFYYRLTDKEGAIIKEVEFVGD